MMGHHDMPLEKSYNEHTSDDWINVGGCGSNPAQKHHVKKGNKKT